MRKISIVTESEIRKVIGPDDAAVGTMIGN
jgi:hypothetical protein